MVAMNRELSQGDAVRTTLASHVQMIDHFHVRMPGASAVISAGEMRQRSYLFLNELKILPRVKIRRFYSSSTDPWQFPGSSTSWCRTTREAAGFACRRKDIPECRSTQEERGGSAYERT